MRPRITRHAAEVAVVQAVVEHRAPVARNSSLLRPEAQRTYGPAALLPVPIHAALSATSLGAKTQNKAPKNYQLMTNPRNEFREIQYRNQYKTLSFVPFLALLSPPLFGPLQSQRNRT